jgi:hypothetical protein
MRRVFAQDHAQLASHAPIRGAFPLLHVRQGARVFTDGAGELVLPAGGGCRTLD